ncbi:MAG: hypothetical protein E6X17_11480 [Sporomusaceae bacterium]|nr:hypothetical protein [Sporomusaceae bacterium]
MQKHASKSGGGRYQLEIGDTERPLEEIISELKRQDELAAIELVSKAPGRTASGSLLTVTAAQPVDADSLKHKLNESGGCMYQIAVVNKLD